MIRYTEHQNIDKQKWDACISASQNKIIYAYSWYLDIVCDGWNALIEGDYQYVMPLPCKKKWNTNIIYVPFFTQQLGIFGQDEVANEKLMDFISSIPDKFKLADIKLNTSIHVKPAGYFSENSNMILPLTGNYENIKKNYHSNLKRKISKAVKNNLNIYSSGDSSLLVQLYIKHVVPHLHGFRKEHENILEKLLHAAITGERALIYFAKNKKNEILAGACFMKSDNRLIYLIPFSTSEGKKSGAMSLIVDNVIKEHCGSEYILDFEGSNIESIARFYNGFGAKNVLYYSYHRKKLSLFMSILYYIYHKFF